MRWGKAFIVSLKIVVVGTLLDLFGLLLLFSGSAILKESPAAGVLLIIVGTIISALAYLTAFIKYFGEVVAEEVAIKVLRAEKRVSKAAREEA